MYSYEKIFNKDAEEIFGKIHRLLKDASWLILSYVDVKEVFTKMNKPLEPYYILDVCYPQAAVDLIHDNEDIGAFIPCKVVLIQHGRETKLIMPKPSVLSKEYLDTDGKVAEKYEEALIGILEKIDS